MTTALNGAEPEGSASWMIAPRAIAMERSSPESCRMISRTRGGNECDCVTGFVAYAREERSLRAELRGRHSERLYLQPGLSVHRSAAALCTLRRPARTLRPACLPDWRKSP